MNHTIHVHTSRASCATELDPYPALVAVLQDLDLSVRTDVAVDAAGKPGFAIGWRESPSDRACIQATPAFRSLADLDAFCAAHRADFRAVGTALQESGYPRNGEWFWQGIEDRRTR
jgi:hypothetical protein